LLNPLEFKLEVKMAKTPENVMSFLNDLKEKLMPLGLKELERLKQLKKKDLEASGNVFDGSFNSWDYGYYNRMLLETEYEINHEKIKGLFRRFLISRIFPHVN
jgi:metallopeptidase MepB